MSARPPVVEFQGVGKTFISPDGRPFQAIRDVTFRIEDLPGKGEFISVLGPSGCGKSTILNLIAGLDPVHPPTEGTVKVCGQEVRGPGPDRGMVFQTYSSYPCYSVLDNVAFGLRLLGVGREEREERAMRWIERVRLGGSERKYPHQLSGGMRQRVALARTLAVHPKIILMDEPFGALDRVTRWEMQDLLVELWHEVQATVFLITHDIAEAVYLGDRIYVMSDSPGTILEEIAVPAPSGNAAATQRTAAFATLVNEVSYKVERRQGEAASAPAHTRPVHLAPAADAGRASVKLAPPPDPDAVLADCPRCGAHVLVSPSDDMLLCPGCGQAARVERAGAGQ